MFLKNRFRQLFSEIGESTKMTNKLCGSVCQYCHALTISQANYEIMHMGKYVISL